MGSPEKPKGPKRPRKPRPLNDNQIAFVDRWLASLPRNATQAYQDVYKVTAAVAGAAGARLLKDVRVVALIAQREKAEKAKYKLKASRIRREISAVAHSDVRHYRIMDDGTVGLTEDAPADAMRAVSGIKIKRRTIPQGNDAQGNALPPIVEVDAEVKLWDKPSALRLGAQIRGLVVKRIGDPDGKPLPPPSGGVPRRVEIVLVRAHEGKPVVPNDRGTAKAIEKVTKAKPAK